MSSRVPIPIFAAWAVLGSRRIVTMGGSAYVATVLLAKLVLDASTVEADRGWTAGVFHVRVVGGTLTILLPPGTDAIVDVRRGPRGRLSSKVGADRRNAHVLVSGVVALGRVTIAVATSPRAG